MEGGAPLYETLEATFPRGLMPEGLEGNIKYKVRRKLRDVGYRVMFPEGEFWEEVVECFAIASLDRLHRGYGENPWFWLVAWPGVIGAAASDFFEQAGTAVERRVVASAATAGHLEELLVSRALGNSDAPGALPAPAVLGLRAVGQSTLPALPNRALPAMQALEINWEAPPLPGTSPNAARSDASAEKLKSASSTRGLAPADATSQAVDRSGDAVDPRLHLDPWAGYQQSRASSSAKKPVLQATVASEDGALARLKAEAALDAQKDMVQGGEGGALVETTECEGTCATVLSDRRSEREASQATVATVATLQGDSASSFWQAPNPAVPGECGNDNASHVGAMVPRVAPCAECGEGMEALEAAPEAYGDNCVVCDACHRLCGPDKPQELNDFCPLFWHCAGCQYDICSECASQQAPSLSQTFGGS